jgi:hypothetical protein
MVGITLMTRPMFEVLFFRVAYIPEEKAHPCKL